MKDFRVLVRGRLVFLTALMLIFVAIAVPMNVGAGGVAPIAEAGGPYETNECTKIIFNASASIGDQLSYRWNFNGTWTNWSSSPYIDYVWNNEYLGTVMLEVSDGIYTATDTATVTVNNVAPTIFLLGDEPIYYETEIYSYLQMTYEFVDPDFRAFSTDTHTAIFNWGDGYSSTINITYGDREVTGLHIYKVTGFFEVTLTVIDDDGGVGAATFYVTVYGVNVGPDVTINEGDTFAISGSYLIKDYEIDLATVNYGDGSGVLPLDLNLNNNSFVLSHTYVDNGVYTVSVVLKDYSDFVVGTGSAIVTVLNVAPTATLGNNGPKDEGSAVTVSFINQYDPGILDTFTYSFDWNNDGIYDIVDQVGASADNTWLDNGVYTVKAMIKDNDGGYTEYTTVVTVNNVAPDIISINGPNSPAQINTPVQLTGIFTDPGLLDIHTAAFEWGDGTSSQYVLTVGNRETIGSHTYIAAGVYAVLLTVADDDGGSDSMEYQYVVIYDPDGGFVTGGGWINSPEGAYVPDPTLTGKATFGFVSKYKKGQSMPTGNTEFQLHTANLNFHSSSYDWLVVAGSKAMYKGTGTINGNGNYGFILSAIDGQIKNGGGVDKFRIKIWDKDNGDAIIYDNNLGQDENADPTTILGGGQIVIHNK